MARDDFNQKTKDILGKRVGYLCSNPKCRKHTIGPNFNPDKATIIGKAAHITAASEKGPRYNKELDTLQRKNISNGIWLCSNCADLIDKDEMEYTISLLYEWRDCAENEMRVRISAHKEFDFRPNIDIDLIWQFGGRSPNGYSSKNEYEFIKEENARVLKTDPPIIHWRLSWNFKLVIFNNSSDPLFNLKIESDNDLKFDYLSGLPTINNLPPLQNIDLEAKFSEGIESTYKEADEVLHEKLPEYLQGLKLKISYDDESGKKYTEVFQIENSEFVVFDNM